MKAVVLYKTCRPEELRISEVPVPEVRPGWVLLKVKSFGLNRSELMLRAYEANATYIKLPRIPGIECAAEIADPSESDCFNGWNGQEFRWKLRRVHTRAFRKRI
jgi:NADPH2:quinone reductase